jgi:hypothetical protein
MGARRDQYYIALRQIGLSTEGDTVNKLKAAKTGHHTGSFPPTKPGQSLAGRSVSESGPKQKPSGPVIYRIEKGADVWPTRK